MAELWNIYLQTIKSRTFCFAMNNEVKIGLPTGKSVYPWKEMTNSKHWVFQDQPGFFQDMLVDIVCILTQYPYTAKWNVVSALFS